jgi:hypothetical protein
MSANLDEYISLIERSIKSIHKSKSSESDIKGNASSPYSNDEKLAAFQKKYEYAQILAAVGRQTEAVVLYKEAFLGLAAVKENSIWTSYYCSVGAHYATGYM